MAGAWARRQPGQTLDLVKLEAVAGGGGATGPSASMRSGGSSSSRTSL